MNPVIRAARIDREPLLLGSEARPLQRTPAAVPAPAVAKPAQHSAAASAPPPMSDAARLAEQDRLLRESIGAERQRVLERAREQGLQSGVEQGRAEYAARVQALQQLIDSMRASLADGIAGTEEMIVEIAVEAVGKMLGDALATREGARAAVREAIRGVHERERLVVRVSPRDHKLLAGENIAPKNGDTGSIELVADERVELGGCLVETSGGTLDGRLETQLQRLCDTLVCVARTPVAEGA